MGIRRHKKFHSSDKNITKLTIIKDDSILAICKCQTLLFEEKHGCDKN